MSEALQLSEEVLQFIGEFQLSDQILDDIKELGYKGKEIDQIGKAIQDMITSGIPLPAFLDVQGIKMDRKRKELEKLFRGGF